MDIMLKNIMKSFPNLGEQLAKKIAVWYNGLPSKKISPADVFISSFQKELVSAGYDEEQLADFLDVSPDDWVNSEEYHAIINDHYSSNHDSDFDSCHYASGSNQFEDIEIQDDLDIFLKVVFDHIVEVICPVCWVREYKENSAKAEAFLDLHYTTHVKESGWVPEGLE